MWSLGVLACGAAPPPPHVGVEEGLERVLAAAREGRHVGLGEVEHGSGALAEQRTAWTRALLSDGARVLAIEAPWSGGMRIQAWLDADCAGATPVEVSLALAHPAWADVSTAELLAWICVHNRERPAVRVIGFDVQDPGAVDWVAERVGVPVRELSRACLGRRDDPTCAAALADPAVPEAARVAITGFAAQLADPSRRFDPRDEAMARLFRLELPEPAERAVIWAHDVHLSEASDRMRVCKRALGVAACRATDFRSLGTRLAEDVDVHSVSFTAHRLELWSKAGEPTSWSPALGAAERRLPAIGYVPLDAPWTATLGQLRGDLSLSFDAILVAPEGRGLLPAQTLAPLADGPITWTTSLAPGPAEEVMRRALALSPWSEAAIEAGEDHGFTRVTVLND